MVKNSQSNSLDQQKYSDSHTTIKKKSKSKTLAQLVKNWASTADMDGMKARERRLRKICRFN